MGIFSCDFEGCERKAYMEVYFKLEDIDDEDGEVAKWSYLCFWHYLLARIIRKKAEGFCRVDTDRETLEHIRQDLWDMQGDLYEIKEKLGIKERKIYEDEKPEEKGFA